MMGLWWKQKEELDKKQREVLKLPFVARCLLSGPPGCGKTNLLMLRAKHLQASKIEDYAVLAYTNTLKRFIRAGQGIPDDKLFTATKWLDNLLWELEGRTIAEDDLQKRRRMVAGALTVHLEHRNKSGLIHTLLVDEIQDYYLQEIELFLRLATNVFFAGDIRQQIYESDLTPKVIVESLSPRIQLIELDRHYRIGPKICLLADRLAKPSKGHQPIFDSCCYVDAANPSETEDFQLPIGKQIARVAERCEAQMDAFPDELIGILCPTNDVLARFEAGLKPILGTRMTVQQQGDYADFDEAKPIVLCTMHGAKGLEFRCVHVVEAQVLKRVPHSRELMYTAVTRAKTLLAIYYSSEPNSFLRDALRAADAPGPDVPIDDLFIGQF